MITYIIVCIVAILFASTESLGLYKHGLLLGFITTTILYALHYNFGNDYFNYYDWFLETLYSDFPTSFTEFMNWSRDPGWDIINYTFGFLFGEYGFFVLVAALGVLQSYAYYSLIRKYVTQQWYWLSMMVYVFTPALFLQSFNVMRLSLVMCIFVQVIPMLQQKKFFLPLLLLIICTFIHGSSIILIPVALLSLIPLRPRTIAITSVVLLIFCFLGKSLFFSLFTDFGSLHLVDRFEHYLDDQEKNTFRFGYIIGLIPFFILVIKLISNEIDDYYHLVVYIWLIGIIIAPLSGITTIIERLTFYFQPISTVILPLVYAQVKNPILRISFITLWLILACINIHSYMVPDSIFYKPYLKYQTIFSVL